MWKTPLEMIQNYVTCEGRYDRVLRCHLRFLMQLSGEKKMNLPYYLLKSIQKMISRVHDHQEHSVCSLFHQGLIKLLIKLLIIFHLKKKGKTWEGFLFESGFDVETQKGEKKGREDDVADNQTKQEQNLDVENNGLTGKLSQVNDELLKAGAVKNDDKAIEPKYSTRVKLIEYLKGKYVDSSLKPRTRLRRKLEMEASPKFTENSEIVVIEELVNGDRVQLLNEEQVSEGETFVELQGRDEHILEIFCIGKQNYDKNEMDTGLASVQKEDIMVDIDESNLIPELTQIRKFMISYEKQNEYLHELNES